jgi:hypothetical protein
MVNELFFGKFSKCPGHITKKALNFFSAFFAPAGIELLNLWNDFRKVVKFIDENQTWLRPLMDRVASNKKAEEK